MEAPTRQPTEEAASSRDEAENSGTMNLGMGGKSKIQETREIKGVKVAMINSGGAPGVWRALEALGSRKKQQEERGEHDEDSDEDEDKEADVILVQELEMGDAELAAFRIHAKKKGYRMHDQCGEVRRAGRYDNTRGGVAILVRKDLPQRKVTSTVVGLAQCIAVWVCAHPPRTCHSFQGRPTFRNTPDTLDEQHLSKLLAISCNPSWK